MRSVLSEHPCLIPSSVGEALRQRAEIPSLHAIAGGTEVMVWMNEGRLPGGTFQSLHRLAPEWRYVRETDGGGLRIGALATYSDVRFFPAVAERYALLAESARVTGALQIQNRGTLAGNIANGSPAADTVPSLLAYDAQLELVSLSGTRVLPLSEYHLGYRKTALRADELISAIIVPPCDVPAARQYYRKVGTRAAQAISKVVVAALRQGSRVRFAIGSVAPTTVRARLTESAIAGGASADSACEALRGEIRPIDDVRSTGEYRMAVACNILRDFLARVPA